jgi:hypothetical protein
MLVVAAAALLFAGPALVAPALAAADSLLLQPAAPSTGPGGAVEVQVLARLAPDGKAVLPVRAVDVSLTASGGGTVAPATEAPGETKWIYRAPGTVAADLEVTIVAKARAFPDAAGSCVLRVKAGAASPSPAAAAGGDDDEGDLVEGAEAVAADPVGRFVTLEKWRARAADEGEWNDKKIPERGQTLYAPGREQEFKFRLTSADVAGVEVHWWRNDRPRVVRAYTEKNKRISVDRDQDGLLHIGFTKVFREEKSEYTFSIVAKTKDGKTLRENLVVVRAKPPKEGGDEKGKGKKK